MNKPFQLLENVQASLPTKTINYWIFGQFTFYMKEEEFRRKGIITATDSEVLFYSEDEDQCNGCKINYDDINVVYNEVEHVHEILVNLTDQDSYAKMSLLSDQLDEDFIGILNGQIA